jgi:arginine deiminase
MVTKVFSEIGRLKKVLVHTPGQEIDIIVPGMANRFLFDDILDGDLARKEHLEMCRVLEKYGVEVYQTKDLLREALFNTPGELIESFIKDIVKIENLSCELEAKLNRISREQLSKVLIEGIPLGPKEMKEGCYYELNPAPNLLFVRDPVIMCRDKIFEAKMTEKIRWREAKIMSFIFNHHPEFAAPSSIINIEKNLPEDISLTLEGGDFLVFDEKTIVIAWSKRTTFDSIKILAEQLKKIGMENLIVAKLPQEEVFMHIDTVFTRINTNECLIYPPLFDATSKVKAEILHFNLLKDTGSYKEYDTIFDLFETLGVNITPIYCGGKESLITQKREQATLGANSVCIAPGVILTYSRNINTIKELSAAGYHVVSSEEALSPYFIPDFSKKVVVVIKGVELVRGRGGARCLTHPLSREI